MRKAFLMFSAIVSLITNAHATSWVTYHDEDWIGYTITYPAFLHGVPFHILHPDDENDHIRWRTSVLASEDGEEQLKFNFYPTSDSSKLQEYFEEELTDCQKKGDTITYSVIKDNWYVISGVDSDEHYEFYTKSYFIPSKGDDSGEHASFNFSYPHSEHATYDPMVSIIAKGFIP